MSTWPQDRRRRCGRPPRSRSSEGHTGPRRSLAIADGKQRPPPAGILSPIAESGAREGGRSRCCLPTKIRELARRPRRLSERRAAPERVMLTVEGTSRHRALSERERRGPALAGLGFASSRTPEATTCRPQCVRIRSHVGSFLGGRAGSDVRRFPCGAIDRDRRRHDPPWPVAQACRCRLGRSRRQGRDR